MENARGSRDSDAPASSGAGMAMLSVSSDVKYSDAVRVRLDPELLAGLDRIEAYARGRGQRNVTRSALIRNAITAFVEGVESEIPEVKDVELAGRT